MADQLDAVVIKELVPNGETLTLAETDLPFGKPRDKAAFESGGAIDMNDDGYNPGSKRPVVQVSTTNKERPFVIQGAWRDGQWGEPGRARRQRNLANRIRTNANPVKITWGDQVREGILREAKFGEEGPYDITYELTFFIAVGVTETATKTENQPPERVASIDELRASMQAKLAELRTRALALVIDITVRTAILTAMSALDESLTNLGTIAASFERTVFRTPQDTLPEAKRVASATDASRDQVLELQAVTESIYMADVATSKTADVIATGWKFQYDTAVLLEEILDSLRTIRVQALAQVRDNSRLYRVQASDTIESIAQSQLGSRSRSHELGVTDAQLVAGKLIRIPSR